jgi:hypothetical protein
VCMRVCGRVCACCVCVLCVRVVCARVCARFFFCIWGLKVYMHCWAVFQIPTPACVHLRVLSATLTLPSSLRRNTLTPKDTLAITADLLRLRGLPTDPEQYRRVIMRQGPSVGLFNVSLNAAGWQLNPMDKLLEPPRGALLLFYFGHA